MWLALAGILHQSDIDAFAPLAGPAFGFLPHDPALRITNGTFPAVLLAPTVIKADTGSLRADGQLLGAPSLVLPHVDSAVALVAGTGSVALGACPLALLLSFRSILS